MDKKLDRLKRIERLQKQIHELSTWKVSRLAQRREQLVVAHAEMISALGEGLLSFGGAASAATRRIRALEVEAGETAAAHETEIRQAFAQGMRAKAAGRAVQTTAAEARADSQKQSLEELIEQSQQVRGSVPRKL